MPMRRVTVNPRGPEAEPHVFRDFASLSLADKHVHGRSYKSGDYYSSSEPRYDTPMVDTQPSGRTYKNPPPKSYHGPHFEKGPAQEKLWNERRAKGVWDPYQPTRSVAARPETYGRAHSIHQSRVEHQYDNPYEKRPQPYPPRVEADYDAYKGPSDGYGAIAAQLRPYKNIPVGRKHLPKDSDRDDMMQGRELANAGRYMANLAGQSRAGFQQKYPQCYEGHPEIITHDEEVGKNRVSAQKFRRDRGCLNDKLKSWGKRVEQQGRH